MNNPPVIRGPRAENGTGSVRPYKGQWRVKITVGLVSGKQRQISRVVSTRKEAELLRAQLIADASRGILHMPSRMLVRDLLHSWLLSKTGTISPKSWENYRYLIEHYICPALGAVVVQKLKPSQVRDFYVLLARTYSTSLLRQIRTILVQALDNAVLEEVLARNPAKGLRLPVKQVAAGDSSRALAPDEVQLLLAAADPTRQAPLLKLLILTGLRRSEICGLKWAQVDVKKGHLHVRESVAMVGGLPLEGTPKTKASSRTIPLAASTVALLQSWRAVQVSDRTLLGHRWQPGDHVFTNLRGGALHPDALSRMVSKLGKASNLGRVRCHDLRHTFASLSLARGVPAEVVQGWLGHTSVNVTLNIYRHLLPHEHRQHVAGIAQLLELSPANVPFGDIAPNESTRKVR